MACLFFTGSLSMLIQSPHSITSILFFAGSSLMLAITMLEKPHDFLA
jgi:hypothetical protein